MASGRRRHRNKQTFLAAFTIVAFVLLSCGNCQLDFPTPPAFPNFATAIVNDRISNVTNKFIVDLGKQLSFCIRDPSEDWNNAFDFSQNQSFVTECLQKNGDLMQRLCTAYEIQLYFDSYQNSDDTNRNFVGPNQNCNLTSWPSGCEPGWACSVGQDVQVNLSDTAAKPERTLDCGPCCAGFFCPRGLTCMIPCPLGSFCPVAKLNESTGYCDPYRYQLPPTNPSHTCGSADVWADVERSREMFCPAGYFCPSTIQKLDCSSGHYCKLGSTSPRRCFRKSSCEPNSANQNITLLGALLMVATSLLLLIIYNFSDQLLTNRERKQAKSREAAARMAREAVQARQRWKAAKDKAKKHAVGIHTQFPHTFAKRKFMQKLELEIPDQSQSASAGIPGSSASIQQSVKSAALKNVEPSYIASMSLSLDMNSDSQEDFSIENGHNNMQKSKDKRMSTRSQIFKYAYRQIEREKALRDRNKDLTFSGVIAMATKNDTKMRPMIEITFKDLTLTLKRSQKQLLRCLTGMLTPSRITAVMGPSGAGKTTFLNAVAGKTLGCHVTGSILINGKTELIRAYKKIIGFVPQDDIVHGNLTVQENLSFSARCRLPENMSKADRVLVVERVIDSLGLQGVRDSLVGTVEKRGISGGQRKRVNVGLEMVIEPSLLILDEPTSGLDSATSQLLLRALRREALQGVTICMVVHQPSFSLFKMFDDLILLAKGGLSVYHGPVKQLEEYFAGLGIIVPERINPPDYFIDIIEGIEKPEGLASKELPVRWMLHNGYIIPPDMLPDATVLDKSAKHSETTSVYHGSINHSNAGEKWYLYDGILDHNQDGLVSKATDLSNRRTPGILRQYKYFLGRVTKQRLREARIQGIDFLILWLAGICLGLLAKLSDEDFGKLGFPYTVIAVSLLCKIGALRSFSLDKLEFWRERGSGMSSLAYFLSKDTVDHFNTLIKPIVYLSMFYFFNAPRSPIADNYAVLVSLVYCVTGIGYTFAICFQPGSAQLWSALVPVVLTLVSTQKKTKVLSSLCYPKWAVEAFVIANAERYSGVWLISRCGVMMKAGYNINYFGLCILILFAYGFLFRCIAFCCLIKFQKR